jgi:hypothetical protein
MDGVGMRLRSRSLVKFIVGMTTFDPAETRFLAQVYALAGADIIDVAAEPGIVRATRRAVAEVRDALPDPADPPRIMVSTALPRDPHLEGAALEPGQRAAVAPATQAELRTGLRACLDAGAEMVELHASGSDDRSLEAAMAVMQPLLADRYLSVCLGTQGAGATRDIVRQARRVRDLHGPRTMIQAEGRVSAGRHEAASSLAGLALSRTLLAETSAYVLVAGGANPWTRAVAEMLGVAAHGVAIGTYARSLVKPFQAADREGSVKPAAVELARGLVRQLRGSGDAV